MIKSYLHYAIILLLPLFANAQFLQFQGAFVPNSSYYEKSGKKIPDSKTDFKNFSFSTAMPFYFSKDSVSNTFSMWMGMISGNYTHLAFENIPEEYPEELIQAMLLVNNIRKLKENHFLSLSFGGGVMGEREHLNAETIIYMTGINYYQIFFRSLELGVGLFVTNMFGSILVFPMPHFQLSLGKKTTFHFSQRETSLKHSFDEIFAISLLYKGHGTLSLIQRSEKETREKKLFQAGQQIIGIRPEFKFKKGKYSTSLILGYAYNRNYRLVNRNFFKFMGSIYQDSPYTHEEAYMALQFNYRFF